MNNVVILQVEDDENDILLLRYACEAVGLANPLISVRDGQEGIDYLRGAGEFADRARFPLPSLLLLDLKSPRKDGIEVLQWVRAQPSLRRLVVILLTASRNKRDIELAYENGANAFVVKPAGIESLIDLVRAIKDFWLTRNRFASIDQQLPQPNGAPAAAKAQSIGAALRSKSSVRKGVTARPLSE